MSDESEGRAVTVEIESIIAEALQRTSEELEREACDGAVTQVLGPVVDVGFKGELPLLGSLLRVGHRTRGLPLEVVELVGVELPRFR